MNLLTIEQVMLVHERQLEAHGGSAGCLRDPGLLESALGRVEMHVAYSEEAVDAFAVAAIYLKGIAHAFVDGNKRTGLVCAFAFLRANKAEVRATPAEMLALAHGAAGEVSVEDLAKWLRERAR